MKVRVENPRTYSEVDIDLPFFCTNIDGACGWSYEKWVRVNEDGSALIVTDRNNGSFEIEFEPPERASVSYYLTHSKITKDQFDHQLFCAKAKMGLSS